MNNFDSCGKNYEWDPASAGRKFSSDIHGTISITVPGVHVEKEFKTGPHNPKTDAYRACAICGKHWNYHVNGKCPC